MKPTYEYFIRRLSQMEFEARKFSPENNATKEVYTLKILTRGKEVRGLDCNCMAGVNRGLDYVCKHKRMVAQFLKAGEPQPFSVEG